MGGDRRGSDSSAERRRRLKGAARRGAVPGTTGNLREGDKPADPVLSGWSRVAGSGTAGKAISAGSRKDQAHAGVKACEAGYHAGRINGLYFESGKDRACQPGPRAHGQNIADLISGSRGR